MEEIVMDGCGEPEQKDQVMMGRRGWDKGEDMERDITKLKAHLRGHMIQ